MEARPHELTQGLRSAAGRRCSDRAAPSAAPHGGSQNFSLPLLRELRDLYQPLKENAGHWPYEGQLLPVHYSVLRSAHPDYFSLGGDLTHFRSCIQQGDRVALQDYARLCLDIMYELATSLNRHVTTITLVQGRALGGGFEAALSADFLIAEEHSTFGDRGRSLPAR